MRMIGEIQDEAAARTFGDFLYAQGIGNELERSPSGGWTVWVKSDDDLGRAVEFLRAFARNPSDPLFLGAAQDAANLRRRENEDLASHQRRVRDAKRTFVRLGGYRFGRELFHEFRRGAERFAAHRRSLGQHGDEFLVLASDGLEMTEREAGVITRRPVGREFDAATRPGRR